MFHFTTMERDALHFAGTITSENPSEVLVSALVEKGQSLKDDDDDDDCMN